MNASEKLGLNITPEQRPERHVPQDARKSSSSLPSENPCRFRFLRAASPSGSYFASWARTLKGINGKARYRRE